VALSVRSSVVTGSDKKAKPAEKQTPDPKMGYQSQLKQLEARMKEQLKQIQHQVTGECHPVPTSLLVTAVSVAALASECPQTRARQLTEINFGSADVGVGYGSTSAGQKQKRADSAEISEQITEHVGNDSVKHLELLEHMASTFKTNNPEVEPDKHVAAVLEVAPLQYPNPPPNIPLHTQYARIHLAEPELICNLLASLGESNDSRPPSPSCAAVVSIAGRRWGYSLFVSHLKGLFKGRYADVNRQGYQAVLSIIASKCCTTGTWPVLLATGGCWIGGLK
jgi:hypothetical protein